MNSTDKSFAISIASAARALAIVLVCHFPAVAFAGGFDLTVTNGTGSGNYAPGTVVHVWANPYDSVDPQRAVAEPDDPSAPMTIFDRWTGDTASLEDVRSAHTTAVMPGGPVQVTATYKPVTRWTPPRLISHFPSQHHAVIFMLHGGGGQCGVACLSDKTEARAFVKEAVSRGYAVVMLQSHDYLNNPWGVELQNAAEVDLKRLRGARKHLVAQGAMRASDPVYLLGISGGGMFASLLQHDGHGRNPFPVEAIAIYVAPGFVDSHLTGTVPTIFCVAKNDALVPNEAAMQNFGALLDNGVPTQVHELQPSPLHAERFWVIDGLNAIDSAVIFASLQTGGYVDGAGYVIDDPDYSGWEVVMPEAYRKYESEIGRQMQVAYAGHSFFSSFNHRVLDFFDLPVTINEAVPRIDAMSPSAGYPGSVVTLTGDSFVGISQIDFQGTPGIVEAITPTKLWVLVPPGAVSGAITVTNSAGSAQSPQPFVVKTEPVIESFNPAAGAVESEVQIVGQWLEDTVAVTFHGVPAEFTIVGEGVVSATVPPDAPPFSFLSITTPGGTVVSESFFTLEQ